jgi:hypothetical protein
MIKDCPADVEVQNSAAWPKTRFFMVPASAIADITKRIDREERLGELTGSLRFDKLNVMP